MGPITKVQSIRSLPSIFPPLGLSYNFISRAEVVPEMGKSFQQVVPFLVYTDAHPIIYIVAPPVAYTRNVPHFDDQNQIYHTTESSIRGDEVRYEDFREMKEGF